MQKIRLGKNVVIDLSEEYPSFELLFSENGFNLYGKKFMKDRSIFVKNAFLIAYQCGYPYTALTSILKAKSEKECEKILTTERQRSYKLGKTAYL